MAGRKKMSPDGPVKLYEVSWGFLSCPVECRFLFMSKDRAIDRFLSLVDEGQDSDVRTSETESVYFGALGALHTWNEKDKFEWAYGRDEIPEPYWISICAEMTDD